MTFPRFVARTNRYWVNPVARRLAGKILPFMLIRHVGRRSGKAYETPVWAFRNGDRFLIALTYGPGTDWLRNLQAAGSGEAVFRGERYLISPVEIVRSTSGAHLAPPVVQAFLDAIGVREYLFVDARLQ